MKALIIFIGWLILFVRCWPVAPLVLILGPVPWLNSVPLRRIGVSPEAVSWHLVPL